jgi:two-component system, NtrC family, response regulator HydG
VISFHYETIPIQYERFVMKAKDLKLEEIIDFSQGKIHLHERRLVMHSIHAFAQLRKDLMEKIGPERTRRIFTRFGYYWGQADAAAMKRIFKWDNLEEWLKAGPRMHTIQGVTNSVVKSLKIDGQTGCLQMDVVWRDSGEVDEHLLAFGKSQEPVCWMLVGYASGYATFCLEKNIYFIEQKCRAKGDRVCTAIGKNEESWGKEIKPHLKYFQEAESIQREVLDLSKELKSKTRELAKQRKRLEQLENIPIGSFAEVHSKSFKDVLGLANRVAPFDTSILITGESGSGKEIMARYIHKLSLRANKSFLGINCGALPETLLESELFGHKAGSFTGAISNRVGIFEQAQGGIIFLDEIGDISLAMQVKLLRVLQEKEVIRVGESKPHKIDVRIMAATNRDLPQAIRDGKFREDLYYRLGVFEIEVPPLRERTEDILPLARYFIKQLSKKLKMPELRLEATCLDYLVSYSWPGNVREMENALERAAVMSQKGLILPESLPTIIVHSDSVRSQSTKLIKRTLAKVEQDHIQAVLELTGNNRSRAAKILGISPTTLWRKTHQKN